MGMREFKGAGGLEWLGVLVGRSKTGRDVVSQRLFLVVGPSRKPRVPQDMVATQPLPITR